MARKDIQKKENVSVIIPAYNEAETIFSVIKDVHTLSNIYNLEIIVVDDGSKDGTSIVAKKSGAHKVIIHKKNKGKGAAFRTGIMEATGDYVVQIDADKQLIASEIPKLVEPLKEGYDMVIGARCKFLSPLHSDFTSFIKMCGNFFLSFSTSIVSGRKVVDVMTGLKAFKRAVVLDINPKTNDFGYEAELVVKAAKKKYKMKHVMVTCMRRQTGESNLKTIKHGLSVFKTIIQTSFDK